MFNQVKKNESVLERIKGYQGEIQIHPGKMEVCQIEKKMQLSAIKFRKKNFKKKKRKENLARLKTQKGGLGTNKKKKNQLLFFL